MVFKLEEMTLEDEQFVFSEKKEKLPLGVGFVRRGRSDFWALDRERNFFIFQLKSIDPREPKLHYILSLDGELAVIKLNEAASLIVTASVLYLPETLKGREAEVQAIFAEGFQVGAPAFVGYEGESEPVQMVFSPEDEGK